MDARRTSARTLKRKAAWGPTVGSALAEHTAEQSVQQEQLQGQLQQQQHPQPQQLQLQLSTPLSQNGQPCGRAPPQMLSPPDMVWPATALTQVPLLMLAHTLKVTPSCHCQKATSSSAHAQNSMLVPPVCCNNLLHDVFDTLHSRYLRNTSDSTC